MGSIHESFPGPQNPDGSDYVTESDETNETNYVGRSGRNYLADDPDTDQDNNYPWRARAKHGAERREKEIEDTER